MYNVAAMAVTQPLLLAGKKAGHRLVAPGVLQKTARMHFTRQGLSSGARLLRPLKKQPANTTGKLHSAYITKYFFSF